MDPTHRIASPLPFLTPSALTPPLDRPQTVLLPGPISLGLPPLHGQFPRHEAYICVEVSEAMG
jgi:hypothetical protein